MKFLSGLKRRRRDVLCLEQGDFQSELKIVKIQIFSVNYFSYLYMLLANALGHLLFWDDAK